MITGDRPVPAEEVHEVSRRHAEHRRERTGRDRTTSRFERVQENRRSRHELHDLINANDPDVLDDEIVLPVPKRTVGATDAEPAAPAPPPSTRRRFRVWKTKEWKRRSQVRAERARLARPE